MGIKAVYLHVVTYNAAAIQLYESMYFSRLASFKQFYFLHGKPYDSFLYAHYVNGARPPWKWRLHSLLDSSINTTWKWMMSAWSSLWPQSAGCSGLISEKSATDESSP